MHLHDERLLLLGGLPQQSGGAKLLETDVSDAWSLSEAPALVALATTARFSGACFFVFLFDLAVFDVSAGLVAC